MYRTAQNIDAYENVKHLHSTLKWQIGSDKNTSIKSTEFSALYVIVVLLKYSRTIHTFLRVGYDNSSQIPTEQPPDSSLIFDQPKIIENFHLRGCYYFGKVGGGEAKSCYKKAV